MVQHRPPYVNSSTNSTISTPVVSPRQTMDGPIDGGDGRPYTVGSWEEWAFNGGTVSHWRLSTQNTLKLTPAHRGTVAPSLKHKRHRSQQARNARNASSSDPRDESGNGSQPVPLRTLQATPSKYCEFVARGAYTLFRRNLPMIYRLLLRFMPSFPFKLKGCSHGQRLYNMVMTRL